MLLLGFATQRIDRYRGTDQLLGAVFDQTAHPELASYGCLEPSWVFYAGRPIKEFRAPKQRRDVGKFLRRERDGYLITTKDRIPELSSHLPGDVRILADIRYFLEDEQLVIIGPGPHWWDKLAVRRKVDNRRTIAAAVVSGD